MKVSLRMRSAVLSVVLFGLFLFVWHLYVQSQSGPAVSMDPEYAKLMGATAKGASAMPGPLEVGKAIWKHITNPFYDVGPNDKGIGIQLAYSLARVTIGFVLAALVAIPLGFPHRHVAGVRSARSIRISRFSSRYRRSPGCRSRSTPSRTPAFLRSS